MVAEAVIKCREGSYLVGKTWLWPHFVPKLHLCGRNKPFNKVGTSKLISLLQKDRISHILAGTFWLKHLVPRHKINFKSPAKWCYPHPLHTHTLGSDVTLDLVEWNLKVRWRTTLIGAGLALSSRAQCAPPLRATMLPCVFLECVCAFWGVHAHFWRSLNARTLNQKYVCPLLGVHIQFCTLIVEGVHRFFGEALKLFVFKPIQYI